MMKEIVPKRSGFEEGKEKKFDNKRSGKSNKFF